MSISHDTASYSPVASADGALYFTEDTAARLFAEALPAESAAPAQRRALTKAAAEYAPSFTLYPYFEARLPECAGSGTALNLLLADILRYEQHAAFSAPAGDDGAFLKEALADAVIPFVEDNTARAALFMRPLLRRAALCCAGEEACAPLFAAIAEAAREERQGRFILSAIGALGALKESGAVTAPSCEEALRAAAQYCAARGDALFPLADGEAAQRPAGVRAAEKRARFLFACGRQDEAAALAGAACDTAFTLTEAACAGVPGKMLYLRLAARLRAIAGYVPEDIAARARTVALSVYEDPFVKDIFRNRAFSAYCAFASESGVGGEPYIPVAGAVSPRRYVPYLMKTERFAEAASLPEHSARADAPQLRYRYGGAGVSAAIQEAFSAVTPAGAPRAIALYAGASAVEAGPVAVALARSGYAVYAAEAGVFPAFTHGAASAGNRLHGAAEQYGYHRALFDKAAETGAETGLPVTFFAGAYDGSEARNAFLTFAREGGAVFRLRFIECALAAEPGAAGPDRFRVSSLYCRDISGEGALPPALYADTEEKDEAAGRTRAAPSFPEIEALKKAEKRVIVTDVSGLSALPAGDIASVTDAVAAYAALARQAGAVSAVFGADDGMQKTLLRVCAGQMPVFLPGHIPAEAAAEAAHVMLSPVFHPAAYAFAGAGRRVIFTGESGLRRMPAEYCLYADNPAAYINGDNEAAPLQEETRRRARAIYRCISEERHGVSVERYGDIPLPGTAARRAMADNAAYRELAEKGDPLFERYIRAFFG